MVLSTRNLTAYSVVIMVLVSGCSPARKFGSALRSPDLESRREAARKLSLLGENCKPAVDDLLGAFMDSDPVVRSHVITALGKLPSTTDGVVPSVRLGLNDPDVQVRRAAAVALSCMNPVPTVALPSLANALGDEDSILCSFASSLFADLGTLGIPALKKALVSDDPALRRNAAVTLGRMGRDARYMVPELKRLLDDSDEDVRHAAAESIDRIQ